MRRVSNADASSRHTAFFPHAGVSAVRFCGARLDLITDVLRLWIYGSHPAFAGDGQLSLFPPPPRGVIREICVRYEVKSRLLRDVLDNRDAARSHLRDSTALRIASEVYNRARRARMLTGMTLAMRRCEHCTHTPSNCSRASRA